jgi:hypothetical protein
VGHILGLGARRATEPPDAAGYPRTRLAAARAAKVFFLNACSGQNVLCMIDEGAMICTGGEAAPSTIG